MSLALIAKRVPIFVVAAGLASAVAAASPPRPSPPAAKQAEAAPAPDENRTKYCVQNATTGSRMPRKTCLTKREWARQGVDIEQALKTD